MTAYPSLSMRWIASSPSRAVCTSRSWRSTTFANIVRIGSSSSTMSARLRWVTRETLCQSRNQRKWNREHDQGDADGDDHGDDDGERGCPDREEDAGLHQHDHGEHREEQELQRNEHQVQREFH